VGDRAVPEARAALGELCAIYWYPLYAFVRRKGHDPQTAQDLVQGFFAALLEKEVLATIDRSKGRFRSFLMAACTHYLANQRDHTRALKRGGGCVLISIEAREAEGRYRCEPSHELTPERLFERRWAMTLLDLVLGRLEAESNAAGKGHLFAALGPSLLGKAEKVAYARVARELGCSEGAARTAAHRLRARFRDLLRVEIARTVDDPAAVEQEIRDLLAALAG
jgi:RNA polymerase sigma-70 factor (ECF subfamily)